MFLGVREACLVGAGRTIGMGKLKVAVVAFALFPWFGSRFPPLGSGCAGSTGEIATLGSLVVVSGFSVPDKVADPDELLKKAFYR